MISIIDYGMGNLRSVQKAFERVGSSAQILPSPPPNCKYDILVRPGVAAFADAMEQLRRRGWVEPIKNFISFGKPFLGICLGMQLLFEGSEEDAEHGDLVPGLS